MESFDESGIRETSSPNLQSTSGRKKSDLILASNPQYYELEKMKQSKRSQSNKIPKQSAIHRLATDNHFQSYKALMQPREKYEPQGPLRQFSSCTALTPMTQTQEFVCQIGWKKK